MALTEEGCRFEQGLRREQVKLLQRVFAEAGQNAVDGWMSVNLALGQTLQSGACPVSPEV
ncbi:MarR family transcriptional regulator, partial [Pseudomonas coronafaciens pv. garcae]